MFSSALKSISSTNINSNYSVASTPTCTAGPWKVYDAKKKSTGKAVSVFVFDRRALDAHGSGLGRSGAAAFRRAADGVVDRLRREASSLARLRHPSVLELVEPVEDTRGGGLQFATEAVTGSLASVMQQDSGSGGSRKRSAGEDSGSLDELELQKGLLQLGKALEFLHETAGLVHGNLAPEAVLINSKSDWKISGLGFSEPAKTAGRSAAASSSPSFSSTTFSSSSSSSSSLDPTLPRSVQASLDYAAPECVIDGQPLSPAADMYALGLLCVALYSPPSQQRSPLASAHGSVSAYRRLFADASTTPSPTNNFLSPRPLPRELAGHVLPRLLARRAPQRMSAADFQTSEYFDNVLVSTIRFLDAFPAKTPAEKQQFLRGLRKVLPSFPRPVMEKKLLPALLDELKDRQLAPAMLQNVFAMVDLLTTSRRRAVSDRVLPALKELFAAPPAAVAAANTATAVPTDRDPSRDASLMVFLEHLSAIAANTSGREFKDDAIPIVALALESPTPSVVDAALRSIPVMLPVLDFSTIKHELFPVVGAIFSKTNSMAIKIRGLQAFVILCGGSPDDGNDSYEARPGGDGLDGLAHPASSSAPSSSSALDKYTMQEKIVPLIKAIRTKEPAVMMEALRVLRVVGWAADTDFVALEILPILWTMGLGPLLNLYQFQSFMKLIRSLSARVEDEQAKKLQDLTGSGTGGGGEAGGSMFLSGGGGGSSGSGKPGLMDELSNFSAWDGGSVGAGGANGSGDAEDDFERLVKGKGGGGGGGGGGLMDAGWGASPAVSSTPTAISSPAAAAAPTFSWSTTPTPTPPPMTTTKPPAIAPKPPAPKPAVSSFSVSSSSNSSLNKSMGSFPSLVPSSTQFSQALPAQPMRSISNISNMSSSTVSSSATAAGNFGNAWSASSTAMSPPLSSGTVNWSAATATVPRPSFSLPPPPGSGSSSSSNSLGNVGHLGSLGNISSNLASGANYSRANLGHLGLGQGTSSMSMGTNGTGSISNVGSNLNMGMNMMSLQAHNTAGNSSNLPPGMTAQPGKTGLDKYESLL